MSSAAIHHPSEEASRQTTPPQQHPSERLEGNAAEASQGAGARNRGMPAHELLRRQMAHCGEYTFQALNKVGRLSPEDTSRITQRYLKDLSACERGRPFPDALLYLVTTGWNKSDSDARDILLELTRGLLRYSKTKVSHLTFAHQTDTPIEFYNSYPAISEISRLLSCPITQVSEKDFLTVTSINPFTASAAARLISNELEAEVGRKPFTFVTTTDLNAWKYACERHFGT